MLFCWRSLVICVVTFGARFSQCYEVFGSHAVMKFCVFWSGQPEAGERSCQDYQGLLPHVDIFSFRQSYYQTTSPTSQVLSSHTAVPEAKPGLYLYRPSFPSRQPSQILSLFLQCTCFSWDENIFAWLSGGICCWRCWEGFLLLVSCSFLHVKGLEHNGR